MNRFSLPLSMMLVSAAILAWMFARHEVTPAAQPAEAASCVAFGFGYNEQPDGDWHVHQFGNAHSRTDGVDVKKVSYTFVAINNDRPWKKTYRGTDPAVDGEWDRLVNPKVGFGSLTFTYQATATMTNGTKCSSNKVTLNDDRAEP